MSVLWAVGAEEAFYIEFDFSGGLYESCEWVVEYLVALYECVAVGGVGVYEVGVFGL